MRRHTPTLYTHPESDADDEGDSWSSRHSFTPPSTISSSKQRSRARQRSTPPGGPAGSQQTFNANLHRPNYSNIYNQFVRRYRSGPGEEDFRNDPESHYNRGLGQLVDGEESDDEESRNLSLGMNGETQDRLGALMLDSEPIEPQTVEDRERLEWQTMLASVLAGDVLKAENSRIAVALRSSLEEKKSIRVNIWLGIRAKVHGRTVREERRRLDERRLRVVEATINEILAFRVSDLSSDSAQSPSDHALQQVNAVLHRLDIVNSLYPSLRSVSADYPTILSNEFQSRVDTLNTWSTVITSLRQQISVLRKWTGSETLDVYQPNSSPAALRGADPVPDATGTAFVDRLLKEESIQRQFEKGAMTTIHALVGTTRDAHVNLAPMFHAMNLPSFEQELVPLVSFLTNLAQAVLRVRLDYAQKLKSPDILILDQLTEDLKVKIGFACTLKRQYEAFLVPDPGGNWRLPPCISEDYDSVILEALTFFFKLIHWKLKSGAKGLYFKETDIIEAQWATFSDVSLTIPGGATLVAEQLCALTNKLMVRVTNYFDAQIRIPIPDEPFTNIGQLSGWGRSAFQIHMKPIDLNARPMSDEQVISWYGKILDGVKQRYRKLQRLTRVLTHRLSNSAEYDLESVQLDLFMAALVETDHCLIYTQSYEEDGIYVIASQSLRERPDALRRILMEAFQVNEADEHWFLESGVELDQSEEDEIDYILIISPLQRFLWNGIVVVLPLQKFDLKLAENRIRLVSDGSQHRLALAKRQFAELFLLFDEEGQPTESPLQPPPCVIEQQAHLPSVDRELRKINRATNRLAESIVGSIHHVRKVLREAYGYQELLENWYSFASEHGQHVQKYMDRNMMLKFNQLLIKLAISWVAFICDDCDPNDRKTFRWAVMALEFTLHRTRRNNILHLPDDEFEMLRQKVATCMTLLISHFDILGARSTIEAKREQERQQMLLKLHVSRQVTPEEEVIPTEEDQSGPLAYTDPAMRMFWERTSKAVRNLEEQRSSIGTGQPTIGRVLDEEKLVDRSLVFLAGSRSNVSIRWQQGRFIGAGTFGSVYLAVNLDSGSLMAVKEIKFQEMAGLSNLYSQIKDELAVMEMLHHPNVVEYYGIEVHRDKVYIFEEYCQGGSLAALLEHGRIEDEGILQVYTMQLLEGLAYLHSKGVVHRDIKPDNILLDHMGVIKYVDFGAAKILAKNQRTIARSRRFSEGTGTPTPLVPGSTNNSLTGTPMYMSPEVIRNNKRGRHGAMDIWSLGCVVLECATGRKPWSNLDNEWAIMFHIGVATQHPPLPEPGQLSDLGIDFIRKCLTIDPMERPTATDLMEHRWMLDFSEALRSYEEAELSHNPPAEMPSESTYQSATVARQAAIIQEKQIEAMQNTPTISPLETPQNSDPVPHMHMGDLPFVADPLVSPDLDDFPPEYLESQPMVRR